MKNPTIPFLLLLTAGCGVTNNSQLSADLPVAVRARLDEARQLLAAGDPDAALLVTDKLLEQQPNLRPARLLAAEANLALVRFDRGAITESFLADAARHYELALDAEPTDAASLMNLSEVYRLRGDYERGRDAAMRAAQLRNGKDPEDFSASLLQAAENEMMMFKVARNAELQGADKDLQPETQQKAQIVLSRLEAVKRVQPGPGYLKASEVYRWLGRTHDEIDQLERGISAAPDYFPLHTRYRELRALRGEEAQCVAMYRALLRDGGMHTATIYSQGIAESTLGDKHRRAGDREAAARAYTASIGSFETCRDNKPEWRDNCNHWLAIEHIALAKMNEEAGNVELAKSHLKKAFQSTPKVAEDGPDGQPLIADSFRANYLGTMFALANAVQSGGTRNSLRDGLEFWEEFIVLHPRKYGWMYNNAALNARDLGAAIERGAADGTPDAKKQAAGEAMRLYERSYELYTVAAELSPNDARIVNDCGLMLVYHLHRDYELARKLFDQAIRVGKAELAEMPATVQGDERNLLEEAIGDAYQNIGKMMTDQGKPFATIEPFLREAVKYYPYQQREAARWLRAGSGRPVAAAQARPADAGRAQAFQSIAEAAQQKASQNDYDGALLVLDAASNKMLGFAPYHHRLGLYSLRYAQQAMASGGSAGQIDGLLADARANLQKAVELDGDPIEPRLYLATANYESRENVNAAKIAASLISHIASRGGTSQELLTATQRIRALAGAKVYIAAKEAESDDQAELQGARNAFRHLERANGLDAETRKAWSDMERWAGDNAAALSIYLRAIEKTPADQTLLGEFVSLAQSTQQCERAVEFLQPRDDAIGLWYLGMATYYRAFEQPILGKPDDAKVTLQRAIDGFSKAGEKNPEFAPSCANWISICQGTQGFIEYDRKNIAAAEPLFLEAAKTAPARVNAPISNNRSVKTGIELIYDHHYRAKDLAAAIQTLERACAVIPDDAALANNLGLFARDHGAALARQGDNEAAKKLYEIAYAAYQNSVRLEPQSVRQRNDLMVMLLYYLKRDVDKAPDVLKQCIADGERQLAENAPEDKQELQDLQESVGDSYENLGYYQMTYAKDPESARKNLEKSLQYYPFKERQSTRYLRQLDR